MASPERWKELEQLLDQALDLAPADRPMFLDRACSGDPALRAEVERLVRAAEATSSFLKEPAPAYAAPLVDRLAEAKALSPGTRLGHYEIERELGRGGMATVYLAQDHKHHRPVAVKVLRPDLAHTIGPERFLREIEIAARLQHPHILSLIDSGQAAGRLYYVMPYVEGESVRACLQREGAFPMDVAVRIAGEVADALEHAHRRGVVHRDIKPENILLSAAHALVADFGIARALGAAGGERLTETGLALGTPAYMSPEQATGEREPDARSDVYALGCTLYDMLAGHPPFTGPTAQAILAKVITGKVPPITGERDTVPPQVAGAIHKALAKLPADRFQSAAEFGSTLAGRLAVVAPPPTEDPWAAPGMLARARVALPWVLLALASGASVILLATRSGEGPPGAVSALLTIPEQGFDYAVMPEVSPDGRAVAFSRGVGNQKTPVWIRWLASNDARPVPGTEGGSFAFWSPDSRTIAFFAGDKLKRVGLSGGTPTTICEGIVGGRGGSWGRDGLILFAGAPSGTISRVPAVGGTPTPVTRLDQERGHTTHRWPRFLPDGRHFLYHASAAGGGGRDEGLYFASVDGNDNRLIVPGTYNADYARGRLLFLRDGVLTAQRFDPSRGRLAGEPVPIVENVASGFDILRSGFSASDNGVLVYLSEEPLPSRGEWLDRRGERVAPFGEEQDFYQSVRISPDGARIALGLGIGTEDLEAREAGIWLDDSAGRGKTRLTFGTGGSWVPVWSPDGSQIAYTAYRKEAYGIYAKPSNGVGDERLLMKVEDQIFAEDWAPDGRVIALTIWNSKKSTYHDIWMLPAVGGADPYAFLASSSSEAGARFSPDGRWLAYESNESGRFEVYVQAFPGPRGKWQVSTRGGETPRWRRDGRELFFVGAHDRVMTVAVQPGPVWRASTPRSLPIETSRVGYLEWLLWDVAPDGRRFLVFSPAGQTRLLPIRVVTNWPALAGKR